MRTKLCHFSIEMNKRATQTDFGRRHLLVFRSHVLHEVSQVHLELNGSEVNWFTNNKESILVSLGPIICSCWSNTNRRIYPTFVALKLVLTDQGDSFVGT